jgi:protein phosphatase
VYYWLTGLETYQNDFGLKPGVDQIFKMALVESRVENGREFARQLDNLIRDTHPQQAVDLHSGRLSHVGMVRKLNEDSLFALELDRTQQSISRAQGIYVVADGMGGHAGGEVASGNIVDIFARSALNNLIMSSLQDASLDPADWLKTTVQAANREVFNLRKSAGNDMGSTLVAAAMIGNQAYITHIGDSRAYLVNQKEIRQLTVDHSLVERMIANHQITREEARRHPQRNVIYRTIGDKPEIEVEVTQHTLEVGEYLLLCSDGLSGMVEDQTMHNIVLQTGSPQEACDEFIRSANAAGGQDNISVILIKVVAN